MSINEALEREAFEAWYAEKESNLEGVFDRTEFGSYWATKVQLAWDAWSARSQAPAPAWVAVSTPPEAHEEVLVWDATPGVEQPYVAYWHEGVFYSTEAGSSWPMHNATYWMPLDSLRALLPPPPQAEEKV